MHGHLFLFFLFILFPFCPTCSFRMFLNFVLSPRPSTTLPWGCSIPFVRFKKLPPPKLFSFFCCFAFVSAICFFVCAKKRFTLMFTNESRSLEEQCQFSYISKHVKDCRAFYVTFAVFSLIYMTLRFFFIFYFFLHTFLTTILQTFPQLVQKTPHSPPERVQMFNVSQFVVAANI